MPNIINAETLAHPLRRQLFTFFAPKLKFSDTPSSWQKLFYDPKKEEEIFNTALQLFELAHSDMHSIQEEICWLEHMMMHFHYFVARLFFKEKYPGNPRSPNMQTIETMFQAFIKKCKEELDHLYKYIGSEENKFAIFFAKFAPEPDKGDIEKRFDTGIKFPRNLTDPKFDFFYNYILSEELRTYCSAHMGALKDPFKSLFGNVPSEFFIQDFELIQIFFSQYLLEALIDLNALFAANNSNYNLFTLQHKLAGREAQITLPAITAAHRHLIKLMSICPTPHSLAMSCHNLLRIAASTHSREHPEIYAFIKTQLHHIEEMRGSLISLYGSIGLMILSIARSLMFYIDRENEAYYKETFLYLALALDLRHVCMPLNTEFFRPSSSCHPIITLCSMIVDTQGPALYIKHTSSIREALMTLDAIALANKKPIDFIGELIHARANPTVLACQNQFPSDSFRPACKNSSLSYSENSI